MGRLLDYLMLMSVELIGPGKMAIAMMTAGASSYWFLGKGFLSFLVVLIGITGAVVFFSIWAHRKGMRPEPDPEER